MVNELGHTQAPLFIELCSGCGILSASVTAAGFNAMAVDHEHNKHKTKIRTFSLDLTKESSWATLKHIIGNCNVIAVHIAPPCGTCSRAREIRLSNQWHGPQPLRDALHPYGVPNMSARDRLRVELANALYMYMCDFCFFPQFNAGAVDHREPNKQLAVGAPVHATTCQCLLFHNFPFMCIWWSQVQVDQFPDKQCGLFMFLSAMRWLARALGMGF